jgi:hypothetical protein
MKTKKYWRYRAYDVGLQIIEGIAEGSDFVDMVFELRQKGLQLLDATSIDQATYEAELRLQRWQQSLSQREQQYKTTKVRNPVARLIRWLVSLPTRLFFIK